ncbi:MAG: hypothetical protein PHY47_01205 [Lachnospiraceae bacterium]|nr:hypothetical protein [Lachnospiraceae bacterium]
MTQPQRRESARERNARILREAFEATYGDLNAEQLKNAILENLRAIEDFEEQKKAASATFREQIKDKKDAIQYCRERIDFISGEAMVRAADELLEEDE